MQQRETAASGRMLEPHEVVELVREHFGSAEPFSLFSTSFAPHHAPMADDRRLWALTKIEWGSVAQSGPCPICLESADDAIPLVAPPCGHAFHETCLTQWLTEKRTCPLCRKILLDPSEEDDLGLDPEDSEAILRTLVTLEMISSWGNSLRSPTVLTPPPHDVMMQVPVPEGDGPTSSI